MLDATTFEALGVLGRDFFTARPRCLTVCDGKLYVADGVCPQDEMLATCANQGGPLRRGCKGGVHVFSIATGELLHTITGDFYPPCAVACSAGQRHRPGIPPPCPRVS